MVYCMSSVSGFPVLGGCHTQYSAVHRTRAKPSSTHHARKKKERNMTDEKSICIRNMNDESTDESSHRGEASGAFNSFEQSLYGKPIKSIPLVSLLLVPSPSEVSYVVNLKPTLPPQP